MFYKHALSSFLIPCDWVFIRFSNILCRKTNVIRRRSGSSPDFFKNKIGTKSCNSRHFRWVIVAQQEDRLFILRRIEV